MASALYRSITVYILPKFDLLQVLESIQRFRITDLILVPPIAVLMAKHPAVKKYDLSSLEHVGCGAGPVSRETAVLIEKRLGTGINVKQGWGMTE